MFVTGAFAAAGYHAVDTSGEFAMELLMPPTSWFYWVDHLAKASAAIIPRHSIADFY
jgi:hypothetical protein